MSKEINLTDAQWYNFICGFNAGSRLQNLTAPPYEFNSVLFPIQLFGETTIGIVVAKARYDNSETYTIPVFVQGVNINYSGFSVSIQIPKEKAQFLGVEPGEFGSIGTQSTSADIRYSYKDGTFKAQGLHTSMEFDSSLVLFYLKIKPLVTPTENSPIRININSLSLLCLCIFLPLHCST